ncbi:hypothetical protein CDEN61S_01685 [Castellaniella denitrificans]
MSNHCQRVQFVQVLGRQGGVLGQLARAAVGGLADQGLAQAVEGVVLDDAQLVVQVLAVAAQFVVDDGLGALVALDALAGEDLHVDDGADHAGRHAQRGVLHVGGLLAEDRAQQLFFRRQLGLALGRDLADQHVVGAHFGADVHDPGIVQAVELDFGQVGDVARDFLGSELGVAGDHGQLFDVDRRVAVVGDDALGDQHRVLEVVAVPGHERDQHVLSQGQLAQVAGGAIGQHVAARDQVAARHDGPLVDVGVLVGTGVLLQVVDVHADFAGDVLVVVHADHDALGVDEVHDPAAHGLHGRARVHRHGALDAGTDQRLFRPQAGHGLALHVGTHQGPVGVVVFQEGDQRGGDRHDLRRRDVHVVHVGRGGQHGFAGLAAGDQVVGETAFLVQHRIGLGDDVLAFLDGRQVFDLVGDPPVDDLAVGRFQEAVLVQARVQGQGVDQADVRAFGRLDRADAAVVGRVHVADLEAGALARQAARSQGRHAPLVRDFRQRVGLVHELGQLAGTEEFLDRGRDRLGIDQVVRHQVFGFGLAQAFLDGALDAHQAGAELVLGQLAHAAHAAVAQVIDVVDLAAAVAQFHQQLDGVEDVLVGQGQRAGVAGVAAQAAVDLHPADARQVVGFLGIEQALEQGLDGFLGGRLAGAHHAVDGHARGHLVGGVVGAQGLGNVGALVQLVDVERLDVADARRAEFRQQGLGDLVVGLSQDFAGVRADDVLGQDAAQQEVLGHRDVVDLGGGQVAQVLGIDALVLLDDDVALFVGDVEARDLALPALGHEFEHAAFLVEGDVVEAGEIGQDGFRRHADGLQQDRHRHLAAAVDAEEQDVLGIELEVQPRAAVGNHARGEQQLARAVGLAAVMFEEHARRAVQLGHDDPLGAVDDEGAGVRHERNFAHVDFLFLDFLDGGLADLAVHQHQAHLGAQRRRVGQAALLAFLDVEHGGAQHVADEFQPRHLIMADDRKYRIEGRLQSFFLPFGRGNVRLQEGLERLQLRRQQVGDVLDVLALGEAFAYALLFGVRIRHEHSDSRVA